MKARLKVNMNNKSLIPQKSLILYISLLPVIILVLLILGAGYFLMKDDFELSKIFNRGPQVRRLEGFPVVVDVSGQIDKQRRVIKSQEELEDFLKTVDPTGNLALGEKIDFSREYLIGVSTATLDRGGSKLKVKKVYENKENNELLISLKQTILAENCMVTQQLNLPVDLVAVSKTDYEITFEASKEIVTDCDDAVDTSQEDTEETIVEE